MSDSVQVRFLQAMAHPDNNRDQGAELPLPKEKAERLVAAGICEYVDASAAPAKGKPGRKPKTDGAE